MREGDDDLIIIPCLHHKTAAHKLALLAITQDVEDVLEYYYENIRSMITPEDPSLQHNFFDVQWWRIYTGV